VHVVGLYCIVYITMHVEKNIKYEHLFSRLLVQS